ncbi:hypothetical protein HDA32_001690 [Spinactinospora alkalitolerans]|uniref:histidine kinase n=1 Tax=Spinactinospora alkalitolerans TaxID=687207 RepID=A0A852TXI9_9ACTN|nr:ATP-binding protein [Spinactinospora alkalitolerans]NYE46570.1 hypothetical protein [Spinactinospora alkalitolerans]
MGTTRGRTAKSTIRRQLTRIVLIPSISFLLLWAIMTAAGSAHAVGLTLSVLNGRDGVAGFGAIAVELREERRLTQVYLGDPTARATAELERQRTRTDDAFAARYEQASRLLTRGGDATRDATRDFFDDWKSLGGLRSEVDDRSLDRASALHRYSEFVAGIHLISDAIVVELADHEGLSQGALALDLMRARDEYSQADALLAGVIAEGEMSYEETAHFTYLTASYRDALADAGPGMAPEARDRHEAMLGTPAWTAAERLSRSVVTREPVGGSDDPEAGGWNGDVPVEAREWDEAMAASAPLFNDLVLAQIRASNETAWAAALHAIALNVFGCLLTLATGITAIVIALRSSRRLTERLRRLRTETLEVSDTRLPAIVSRAQRGRRVDVAAELPSLRHGDDEIGQVADAFNTAQRTAVGAAVKQAEIREGANRVFLGIAYRNQTLVQRQLRMLDEIEGKEEDPRALRALFRLDHLVTRGRRYADNLIILGGAGAARRWREPMPLVDVLRGAISETEDYERVRLRSAPKVRVQGFAVADVVHLIAELVENAAQFSPADSHVDVNSGRVPNGLAVDVEDRGLGMTGDAYAEANRTLAHPPEFDVMALTEEPRLGLFVVARLAARHGVRVRLCPSPYGGTRAVAVLPDALLESAAPPAAEPGPVRETVPRQDDGGLELLRRLGRTVGRAHEQ